MKSCIAWLFGVDVLNYVAKSSLLAGRHGQNRFSLKLQSLTLLSDTCPETPRYATFWYHDWAMWKRHPRTATPGNTFRKAVWAAISKSKWATVIANEGHFFFNIFEHSCVSPALHVLQQKVYNWYVHFVLKNMQIVHLLVGFGGIS